MKRILVLAFLPLVMSADDGYMPLSNFSDNQKADYNFVDNSTVDAQNLKTDSTDEGYESVKDNIQSVKPNKTKTEDDTKEVTKKEDLVKEYKKDNILQDTKKENKIRQVQNSDFFVTPKIDFMYTSTDIGGTKGYGYSDKKVVINPEISVSYKNHTLKGESFATDANFKNTPKFNSDLKADIKWYKFSYLYKYENANVGLAYNNYMADFKVINTNTKLQDSEEFPSLEAHFKNEDDRLQGLYGGSVGKNGNIDYSYEYYFSFGYKVLKNDGLVLGAGYKNKTIEYKDLSYKYQGPTVSLTSTF